MFKQLLTRTCLAIFACAISYNTLAAETTQQTHSNATPVTTSTANTSTPNSQATANQTTATSSTITKATTNNDACPCAKQIPLNQPNMSAVDLMVLANQAAVSAFTYNFVNYRRQLADASNYFTPDGWQAFQSALDQSGNLKQVIAKKLVVSAVATGAPIILRQGLLNSRYSWKVEIPLLVSYQSANEVSQHHLIVTMVLQRTQKYVGHNGVGIQQFMAHPSKSQQESSANKQPADAAANTANSTKDTNSNVKPNSSGNTGANPDSKTNSSTNQIKAITPSQ